VIPRKCVLTIPNEEEKALKHSSVTFEQQAQNVRSSPSLPLTYRSMRKVYETVDFTLIDSQLSDIE